LKKNGKAPAALVCKESEPIVAVGAIISDIPMVDKIDISKIKTGDTVSVNGDEVEVE
jgi:predicted aconitase with swiveling domain